MVAPRSCYRYKRPNPSLIQLNRSSSGPSDAHAVADRRVFRSNCAPNMNKPIAIAGRNESHSATTCVMYGCETPANIALHPKQPPR